MRPLLLMLGARTSAGCGLLQPKRRYGRAPRGGERSLGEQSGSMRDVLEKSSIFLAIALNQCRRRGNCADPDGQSGRRTARFAVLSKGEAS